ncbi:MAG: S1-like domain-containing RNA-binding protein [Verrucomicrobiae bacterium]|nr:S1-like domain-containing RNA-binding protein [Verrucomicrobiae bacterium]
MLMIGKRNRLTIVRQASPGLYLDAGDQGEILLPGRYIPPGAVPGMALDVFVYLDSEDRLVATTETPTAMAGDFACLKVVSVNRQIGAFLDWGLPKDLLLPFREQTGPPLHEGQRVVVHIYLDTKTSRLAATMRLNRHLSREMPAYARGQEVSLLIAAKTPLGYNAIVENAHAGLLYHSNLSEPLEIGQKLKGFVQAIRPDGKIDLKLDPSGYQRVIPLRKQILQTLERNGGRMEFDIKSPPAAIRETFGVSKNAFKLALSALYKERRICFRNAGTEFASKSGKFEYRNSKENSSIQ